MSMQLFKRTCEECSKLITQNYSTSFSLGIRTLHKRFHAPIYGVYGFVRFADEIVDTFHDFNKEALLDRFEKDTYQAIEEGISLNPVLHSFQAVVREYNIEKELIEAFLFSMRMDLEDATYTTETFNNYIYGSAEVVGLMCLRVFCEGNSQVYDHLKGYAQSLGKAFQKVNFLRDIRSDHFDRGRMYFPGVAFDEFGEEAKAQIEKDIEKDFAHAYEGILQLPEGAKRGVHLAYTYYQSLFEKIRTLSPNKIMEERIRIPDNRKLAMMVRSFFRG